MADNYYDSFNYCDPCNNCDFIICACNDMTNISKEYVNQRNSLGETVIHYIIRIHARSNKYLLKTFNKLFQCKYEYDINSVTNEGLTILMYALKYELSNKLIKKIIMCKNPDILITDNVGKIAADYYDGYNYYILEKLQKNISNEIKQKSLQKKFKFDTRSKTLEIIEEYLAKGLDPEIIIYPKVDYKILMMLSTILPLLIKYGLDINKIKDNGMNYLMYMFRYLKYNLWSNDRESIIKAYITNGINTFHQDLEGSTILFYVSIIHYDLFPDVDINIKNKKGMTCLMEIFKDNYGIYSVCDKMKSISPYVKDNNGDTILHYCVKYDKKYMFEYIPYIPITNKKGLTPLYLAINEYRDESMIFEMIKYGADPNELSQNGENVLMKLMLKSYRISCYLTTYINLGMNINHATDDQSLLKIAVINDDFDRVKQLIKFGVNLYFTDKSGNIPLYYADDFIKSKMLHHYDFGYIFDKYPQMVKTCIRKNLFKNEFEICNYFTSAIRYDINDSTTFDEWIDVICKYNHILTDLFNNDPKWIKFFCCLY